MIANSLHRIARSSIARSNTFNALVYAHAPSAMRAVQVTPIAFQLKTFSTEAVNNTSAFVEKPLKALDMAVVRQIKAELMEVDKNSDGRYANIEDFL